jgi:hypothetical protein
VTEAKKGLDWGCEKVTGVKATPVQVACKGFELLALGCGRQTQDITDSSYLSYKTQELHGLGLFVLSWNWWRITGKTSTGASCTQATCFFTGWRITGKTSTGASCTQATCSLMDGGLLENKHRSFMYL